jgi:hypothetical protein
LAQARNLREISDGLAATCGKLNHLGLPAAPAKSPLSYANEHRPGALWQRLFYALLDLCRAQAPGKKRKFRFKHKLFSIDATTIDLCLSLFPWAHFRQTKGAAQLHLLLDHNGYLPVFALVTAAQCYDLEVLPLLDLPRGSLVALERGYYDFTLFERWTQAGIFFITRLKSRADYTVTQARPLPQRGQVRADELMTFQGRRSPQKGPRTRRRVVVWDEAKEREGELLTNYLDFGPTHHCADLSRPLGA